MSSAFECFACDLINAQEGLDLVIFAEGRFGGVDLRYSYGEGKTVVVQAKRYKDFNELKSVLKNEVAKVSKLAPSWNMLVISADLTLANKQSIITLFAPFIQNETIYWKTGSEQDFSAASRSGATILQTLVG